VSLLNFPDEATPEEMEAYRLGKIEARIALKRLASQVLAYEIALNKIRRASDTQTTFDISSTTLAIYRATK
jgi:hypothetical protein